MFKTLIRLTTDKEKFAKMKQILKTNNICFDTEVIEANNSSYKETYCIYTSIFVKNKASKLLEKI